MEIHRQLGKTYDCIFVDSQNVVTKYITEPRSHLPSSHPREWSINNNHGPNVDKIGCSYTYLCCFPSQNKDIIMEITQYGPCILIILREILVCMHIVSVNWNLVGLRLFSQFNKIGKMKDWRGIFSQAHATWRSNCYGKLVLL